jgi:polyisoprenoid-binding protein YceI
LGVYAGESSAQKYLIDTPKAHAFVQFRVKHLGISWLYGRFNTFSGEFTYDAKKPENSSVSVNLETASLETDHAERNKHLRSSDFLDVEKYPAASFTSTSFTPTGEGTFDLKGKLTLFKQSRDVTIKVVKVGEGSDPWGGYRVGFEGTTTISPADFGVDMGPMVSSVELTLSVEGIRQ